MISSSTDIRSALRSRDRDIEDEVLRQQRLADSFVFAARAQRREVLASAIKFNERLRLGRMARAARFARQRGVMLLSPYRFTLASDPYFSSVKLLLDLNGNVTDYSGTPTTMTQGSTASPSTARVPFTSSTDSESFGGTTTGNYVQSIRLPAMGTGAFTYEAMIRPIAAQTGRVISAQDLVNSNAAVAYRVDSAGSVTSVLRSDAGTGLSVLTSATGLVATNDTLWYSFAFTRDGSGNQSMLLNGMSVITGSATTDPHGSYNVYTIGAFLGDGGGTIQEPFNGYIASVRVTEGVARTIVTPTGYFPHS